jgi:CubicO group peptidase (beta-lactamase class C family)
VYSPGVRWKYSNLALGIAGMIVEAVSGEKYADYVQRHIFTPLGMNGSSVDRQVDGLATGYGRLMPDGSRKKIPFIDARGLGPATGITRKLPFGSLICQAPVRPAGSHFRERIAILCGPPMPNASRSSPIAKVT